MINSNLKWLFNYWLSDRKNYWDMFRWLDRKSGRFILSTVRAESGGVLKVKTSLSHTHGSKPRSNAINRGGGGAPRFPSSGKNWFSTACRSIISDCTGCSRKIYTFFDEWMNFLRVKKIMIIYLLNRAKRIKFKYTLWTYYKYPNRRDRFLTDNLLSRLCLWYLFFLRP